MENFQKKVTVRGMLRAMQVGEILRFPAERAPYIQTAGYTCGFAYGMKFRTCMDRENREITIERVA